MSSQSSRKRVRVVSKGEENTSGKEVAKKRLKAAPSKTPTPTPTQTPSPAPTPASAPLPVAKSVVVRKLSTDSPTAGKFALPPTTSLGSLPLYGEELPSGGFEEIPNATKFTCDQIREVFGTMKALIGDKATETEMAAQKQRGLVLFSYLKKLNRLAHLYCKDSREQTHEQKLEVDDLHLQLQNLMYEATYLRKEITNCLEFKSQHEDIELVSEEEMFAQAPESISKPEVSLNDEHQKMLSRLHWEMEERKSLANQSSGLESEIHKLETEISSIESKLNSLLPSLEDLRKATLPLQESLGVPFDREREERELALLLPRALYVLFTQAKAYAQVEDPSLTVTIEGDIGEAKAFLASKDKEQSDDDSGDSDGEGRDDGARRKKRRKRSKNNRDKKDLSKAYPLAVVLFFSLEDIGSFQVIINYLPPFTALCASVTSLTLHNFTESPLLEGSALLHCLTEGDTGRTSPNSIVSLNIRKHSGDIFSAAVRQHGFPYKWVQKVCGVGDQSEPSVLSKPSGENMAVDEEPQEFQWLNDPQMELSAQHLEGIIKALKRRFRAQVNLVAQVTTLGNEGHNVEVGPDDDQLFLGNPASQLTKWKALSHSEVKAFLPTMPSVAILNPHERTNRFFYLTLQLDQARLVGIVCVGVAYPNTPPCFAITIEDSGSKDSGSIQTKNIESEVNMIFPSSLEGDKFGQYLLCRQIRRLQECFDLYMAHKQSSGRVAKTLCTVRGKGRLLKLSDI